MKPGIPWSVKGIEPEAREAAKLAARRAGLTLGEWLNGVIFDQSEHIDPSQVESRAWEDFVSSAPPPSEPLRHETRPRPPQARESAAERHDDSALRLQDIARQLADLAQRERQSSPPPAVERSRAADREEFERIIARVDENERQTVEALTAVNDRLSMLGQQISRIGRPGFARPEDVPGYPALETAIRSVVEHIEMSEKRTRDSLTSMQNRLAEIAERRSAPPDGEDILRAAPVLSGLEGRLADMVNRIQRSEGLLTERIESLRGNAQQMANQAQSSAVTSVRGELREVETRLLASLKEAQAAAATAPSGVATEIARLHGDMSGLARRLEDVKAGAASERDVQSLRTAIEQLSARVAQGPDMRPLADMDKRLGDINRRLEQAAAAGRGEPQVGALEQRIAELDHRLAEAMRLQGDQRALRQLEDSIAAVDARVAQTERQLGHLETMEQAIRQLHGSIEQTRSSVSTTAEAAAGRALAHDQSSRPADGPSPELQSLEEGLRAIRESSASAERRHRDTLDAVHATLAEIVAKVAALESASHRSTMDSSPAVEPPGPAATPTAGRPVLAPSSRTVVQEPLSAGDDFIAAARRAAQAAATRPSAPRAEDAMQAQPAVVPIAASAGGTNAAPRGRRRALILAGLVLLVAASVFAYRSLSAPSAPAPQSSRIDMPVRPVSAVAPTKRGLFPAPSDPVVTGSLATSPGPSAPSRLDMPPTDAGPEALRSAAAAGDPRAQFIIAGRYLNGQGPARDMAKAFAWYQQAAARGLAPAQYRLATLYELGQGVATNPVQALLWYERAAQGGNVKAMHNAAVIAAGDKAGPADFSKAFRWFTAAARRGFRDSQFNLAIFHERGLGTPSSTVEAYVWYSLAARQGDPDSGQRAAKLAKGLLAESLKAAAARLAAWSPTAWDDAGNVVTVADPAWNGAASASTVKRSS